MINVCLGYHHPAETPPGHTEILREAVDDKHIVGEFESRGRQGDLSRGEELLAAMDDIYNVLVTMDFPDAITGGLRRTTDMVRGVLERTRSDLTLTMRQKDLENRLEQIRGDKK